MGTIQIKKIERKARREKSGVGRVARRKEKRAAVLFIEPNHIGRRQMELNAPPRKINSY